MCCLPYHQMSRHFGIIHILRSYNSVRVEARAQCTLAQLIYRPFSPTQSTPKISRQRSQRPHSPCHLNFIFYINVTSGALLTTTQIWLGSPNSATLRGRWEIFFHGNKPSFLLLLLGSPSVFVSTKQNLGLRICFRFRRSELRFRFTIRNVIANGICFYQILEFTVLHCISFLFLMVVWYDLVCWCCMVLNCLLVVLNYRISITLPLSHGFPLLLKHLILMVKLVCLVLARFFLCARNLIWDSELRRFW